MVIPTGTESFYTSSFMVMPYNGETIYSYLSRLWHYAGRPSADVWQEEIFGVKLPTKSNFMGKISNISSCFPTHPLNDANFILDEMTDFKFKTCLYNREDRERLRSEIISGTLSNLRNRHPVRKFTDGGNLKFCKKCHDQWRADGQDLRWIRDFQHSSSIVCVKHKNSLSWSKVSISKRQRAILYICDDEACPRDAVDLVEIKDTRLLDPLIKLAERADAFLSRDANLLSDIDFCNNIIRKYKDLTRRKECFGSRMEFLRAFDKYWWSIKDYYQSFEKGVPASQSDWPWRLVTGKYREKRLTRLLMVDVFLSSFDGSDLEEVDDFGSGPWVCLNPFGNHEGAAVINEIHVFKNRIGLKAANFHCQCGFAYSRFIDSNGRWSKPRIIRFGTVAEMEIVSRLMLGASERKIRFHLGISREKFYRLMQGIYRIY